MLAAAVAGGALVWVIRDEDRSLRSPHADERPGRVQPVVSTDAGRHAGSTLSRPSSLLRAALEADGPGLERLVREAAADPGGDARTLRLQVLLARYAELDPQAALALARELSLAPEFAVPLIASWARADPAAVADALKIETDEAYAMHFAIALQRALGGDEAATDRVAALLPPGLEPAQLRIGLIADMARSVPAEAFAAALALEQASMQSEALQRIATVWARSDPRAALDMSDGVADSTLRNAFRREVFSRWSQLRPSEMLDYLALRTDLALDHRSLGKDTLDALARANPRRLFEASDEWSRHLRRRAREVALFQWAERDPMAAYAAAGATAAGEERDSLLRSVAAAYGSHDPDAALAWADTLAPRPEWITTSILSGMAKTDLPRAIATAQTLPRDEKDLALGVLIQASQDSTDGPGPVGDMLLKMTDSHQREQSLEIFIARWVSRDPAGAMAWWLANPDAAGARSLSLIGSELMRRDVDAAIAITSQVPSQYRSQWIGQIARSYARFAPEAARRWIDGLQGQPGHEGALAAYAAEVARTDPQAARRAYPQITDPVQAARVANSIASNWAHNDPIGAAKWAAELTNEDARFAAMPAVARAWAQQDAQAATRWATNLPPGQARDSCLHTVLQVAAHTGQVEISALEAIRSDVTRQQAVVSVIWGLAKSDPDLARELIDRYLTDPALRRQAETALTHGGS